MLASLKSKMTEMAELDIPIIKHSLNTKDAIYRFAEAGRHDKEHLLRYRRNSRTNVYELDGYLDYYLSSEQSFD